MALTETQRNRLRAYANKKDRGREPVFVGRKDLFELVAGNAQAAALGDVEGRTVCIAGPPGIGKTAFLSQLETRSAKPGRIGETGMVCLKIPFAAFSSTAKLAEEIANALPEEWRPQKKPIPRLLDRLGGGSVRIAGLAVSEPKPSGAAGAMFPWRAMPEMLNRVPPGLVVCLYVDEAHGLQPSEGLREDETRNIAVGDLHEGAPPDVAPSGRRVFGVFAGHPHTPEVLEKSISGRFAGGNMQYMRNLSEAESLEYIDRTLDHFRVSQSDRGRAPLARWVAKECGGFPHHLRNAMSAIAEGLLAADSLALSDIKGAFVAKRLRERREDYYATRTNGAIIQIVEPLADVLREWSSPGRSVPEREAHLALASLINGLSADERGIVTSLMGRKETVDAVSLMREMVRRGVLTTDAEGGGCRCPIDSLLSWMENEDGEDRRHVMRGEFPPLAGADPGKRTEGPSHS